MRPFPLKDHRQSSEVAAQPLKRMNELNELVSRAGMKAAALIRSPKVPQSLPVCHKQGARLGLSHPASIHSGARFALQGEQVEVVLNLSPRPGQGTGALRTL